MAEREGFEPSVPCGTQSFQDCRLNHSRTFPYARVDSPGLEPGSSSVENDMLTTYTTSRQPRPVNDRLRIIKSILNTNSHFRGHLVRQTTILYLPYVDNRSHSNNTPSSVIVKKYLINF
jgi:hypothetical protein